MEIITLQKLRSQYKPKMPSVLCQPNEIVESGQTHSVEDENTMRSLFPNTYGMPIVRLAPTTKTKNNDIPAFNMGVILSGGQAPGGHNVISGIFDALKSLNQDNKLYGFLGGPSGLTDHLYIELTADIIDTYRNTGGFDIIGSGRTKLEEEHQFDLGREICEKLNIKALVIIGGDDSNTNAAILAEYYKKNNIDIQVIGCPKTIDGDLKNQYIEASFGFDTTCKVYSELIGNIQKDARSAKKYWHFIRLMGRSASHITLECALQTHPNVCLISEEIEQNNLNLNDIVESICEVIIERANKNLNYGIVLVPEGLIEFVPSFSKLIAQLNDIIATKKDFSDLTENEKMTYVLNSLDSENLKLIKSLPKTIVRQLMFDRDPHGNVLVSQIETEKLLIEMISTRLHQLKSEGKYKGSFATINHFFGYEGRCSYPSNFDADYCYALGHAAVRLAQYNKSGYMTLVQNLNKPVSEWSVGGVPITMMMHMEKRNAKMKPVIKKSIVELNKSPFKYFAQHRKQWALDDCYEYPGPIQYFGPDELCNAITKTLALELATPIA